jgi:hypothetical protein
MFLFCGCENRKYTLKKKNEYWFGFYWWLIARLRIVKYLWAPEWGEASQASALPWVFESKHSKLKQEGNISNINIQYNNFFFQGEARKFAHKI